MEITVKSLLREGPLKTSEVVAGAQDLDKCVKGVTIMEAPDIVDWLAGGEMILTSLYSTQEEKVNYREFVEKLAVKGVSALVIKVRRFVDRIPQEILDTADEVGLPIIELEGNVRFVDVLYPVMEMLFNRQVIELKYYKEMQERFTSLALKGEGLDKITATLAELVENPVSIFDNQRKCLLTTDQRIDQFNEDTAVYEQELLSKKTDSFRHKVVLTALSEDPISQIVVPIRALGQVKAYLTVTENNRPLRDMDFICLEQAATVVTLEMVRRIAVQEVEQKFSNDMIAHLISGEGEINNIRERANLLGWDINHPFIVVVFNLKHLEACLAAKKIKHDRIAFQGIKGEIEAMITNVLKSRTRNFMLGYKVDSMIVLWPVSESCEKTIQEIKTAGQEIQSQAKKRLKNVTLGIGIGDAAAEIQEIPRSYKEAQEALVFGEMLYGENVISSFQELGVYRILCKFGECNDLGEFIPRPLKKLIEYDHENQGDLLKSLEIFLECNGNATKAAKELFIHYKTLLYRLDRIKEITGLDFEDNKNRLELELGFKIMHITGHKY